MAGTSSASKVLLLGGTGLLVITLIWLVSTSHNSSLSFTRQSAEAAYFRQLKEDHSSDDITTIEGQLVASFPEFPVYPDAKIAKSSESSDAMKLAYSARWNTSTHDVISVLDFFMNEAQKNGWEIVEKPQNSVGTGEDLVKFRIGGRGVQVLAEEEGGVVEYSVDFDAQ